MKNKSSHEKSATKAHHHMADLIDELDALGYYKYCVPDRLEEVKRKSIEKRYPYGWEDSGRDFDADAEFLAEGWVEEFVKDIRAFLRGQGVKIRSVQGNTIDGCYKISINREEFFINHMAEMALNSFWDRSAARTFFMINTLLKKANSEERMYALYSANKMRAVFLNEKMYQVIANSNAIDEKDKPRKDFLPFINI
jgi:hypothetical protein